MQQQAARNLDAAKQKEKTLGEAMQNARENLDNALASDKPGLPGLQEVVSAIDERLREATNREALCLRNDESGVRCFPARGRPALRFISTMLYWTNFVLVRRRLELVTRR